MRVGLVIGLFLVTMFSSCSDQNAEFITIDDHSFAVPSNYLIEERISWLPQSQEKGLLFYLNPEAPIREKVSVLIESRDITCRHEDASPQLARQCKIEVDSVENEVLELQKFESEYGSSQWLYAYEDKSGSTVTVASCFGQPDKGDGLCTVLGSYDDLVYLFRVNEAEVSRIPEFKTSIENLLSSWEV